MGFPEDAANGSAGEQRHLLQIKKEASDEIHPRLNDYKKTNRIAAAGFEDAAQAKSASVVPGSTR